jgi:hypothetical protein
MIEILPSYSRRIARCPSGLQVGSQSWLRTWIGLDLAFGVVSEHSSAQNSGHSRGYSLTISPGGHLFQARDYFLSDRFLHAVCFFIAACLGVARHRERYELLQLIRSSIFFYVLKVHGNDMWR